MRGGTALINTRLADFERGLPQAFALPSDPKFWVGPNRAPLNAHSQIRAKDDLSAIKAWLIKFEQKPTTYANYVKEVRRLALWAVYERSRPISALTHEDLEEYRKFLRNPYPVKKWVNPTKRPHKHPEWKPFTGPLSEASTHQAMVIINMMFSWLVEAGYLLGNPLSLSRYRRTKDKRGVTRYIEREVIEHILDSIHRMPARTDEERMEKARRRWLIVLLYQTAMRISEVAINRMGQVRRFKDSEGKDIWAIDVLGKGNKWATVPISEQFLDECAAYRESIGLSGRPIPGDETPLLCSLRFRKGTDYRAPLSRQHIHKLIKATLERAREELVARGDIYGAKQLDKASAHWFRHSAGSHLASTVTDLVMVRDHLRHEDISTTSRYLHTDLVKMHKEITEALALPKKGPRE